MVVIPIKAKYTQWLKLLHNEKGITLVELIVVLALLGLVLGAIYQYFFYGYSSWMRSSAEGRVVQEARLTVLRMGDEVHKAEQAMENTYQVELISNTELRIYSDVIKESDSEESRPELICYRLKNEKLERGVGVSKNDEFPYEYYDPKDWELDQWEIVASKVVNTDIFTIPKYKVKNPQDPSGAMIETAYKRGIVNVKLEIDDTEQQLTKPLKVQATLTVRGKGVSKS